MSRPPPRVLAAADAVADGVATLGADAYRHLVRVLRLGVGDAVALFDGHGAEAAGTIRRIGRQSVEVTLTRPFAPTETDAAGPPLTLLCGVTRGDRLDFVVEKATELGVARIVPVVCERSQGGDERTRTGRLTRWQRIAEGAARQCGRNDVPAIASPSRLDDVLASLAQAPAAERRFVLWESAPDRSLAAALADGGPSAPTGPSAAAITLLIGPEGGLGAGEVAAASAAGFEIASLGPLILRAETAAVVAITLARAAQGGLGRLA